MKKYLMLLTVLCAGLLLLVVLRLLFESTPTVEVATVTTGPGGWIRVDYPNGEISEWGPQDGETATDEKDEALDERPLLRKTETYLGDFTDAVVTKGKGTIHLKVWEPHREQVSSLPSALEDAKKVLLEGVAELFVEYDEIWEVVYVGGLTPQQESEWRSKGWYDVFTMYWKNGRVMAWTWKKPFVRHPVTLQEFPSTKHFITNIFDRDDIVNELKQARPVQDEVTSDR